MSLGPDNEQEAGPSFGSGCLGRWGRNGDSSSLTFVRPRAQHRAFYGFMMTGRLAPCMKLTKRDRNSDDRDGKPPAGTTYSDQP